MTIGFPRIYGFLYIGKEKKCAERYKLKFRPNAQAKKKAARKGQPPYAN
jgi:hypothetical protein